MDQEISKRFDSIRKTALKTLGDDKEPTKEERRELINTVFDTVHGIVQDIHAIAVSSERSYRKAEEK